jgi:hypothetical protein
VLSGLRPVKASIHIREECRNEVHLPNALIRQQLLLRLEMMSRPVEQNVPELPLYCNAASAHCCIVRGMLKVKVAIWPRRFNFPGAVA